MSALGLCVEDILGDLKRWRSADDAEKRGELVPDFNQGRGEQLRAIGTWLYENGYVPECKEPHCDEGNCHLKGECPPPEPY